MRYRIMASYRGAPYEAGVGPADGTVVLFAACPPPEELGFDPAPGHWRKELRLADVQAVWQSRPVGVFRGDRCIVLDDLGDRLHIGYLGHDAYRAEELGYWQVDRGVFELVASRDEVTDIVEERSDYPARPGYGAAPPGYGRPGLAPGPGPAISGPQPAGPPGPGPLPGGPQLSGPQLSGPPLSGPPLSGPPLSGAQLSGPQLPGSRPGPRSGPHPAAPGYPDPAGRGEPGRAGPPGGVALPPPAAGPPLPLEAEAMRAASATRRDSATGPLPAPAAIPAPAGNLVPPGGFLPSGSPVPQAAPVPAGPGPGGPGPGGPGPGGPGPGGPGPGGTGRPAGPAPWDEPPRRRRAGGRMATEHIFSELAGRAAIPAASYSVGEAVDGAMCLVETASGYEVFSCSAGTRHEVRVFSDEESACFYLFGVLAAEAVRTGALAPAAGLGLSAGLGPR
jgi:hypothetical protein